MTQDQQLPESIQDDGSIAVQDSDASTSPFGDPISTYGSDEAIEDGVLHHLYPKEFPWLLVTDSVLRAIEAVQDGRTDEQKVLPLFRDCVMLARSKPSDHLWTDGLVGNITGELVWVARNEKGGITVMFPEDY